MSIVINCKGLQTPGGKEDRDIAYLEVKYKGNTYNWMVYVPINTNLGEFIANSSTMIQNSIDAREAEWNALKNKTKIINDPDGVGEIVVPIDKDEIVRPEFPDYYAKRKGEYPDPGLYLDGIVKNDKAQMQQYIDKCLAVKAKYPKLS